MLSAQLLDRFQEALGPSYSEDRAASVRFAVEFAGLIARVVPADRPPEAMLAMAESIQARTDLNPAEVEVLLGLAMRPEHRGTIDEDSIRAFGGRFGPGPEQALRAAVGHEIDLPGFADRYGAAEALLLLDAWFAVCGVDGVIDQEEIGVLEGAASELGIDPMLVGALFRKHDTRHGDGDLQFELTRDRYLIGRSPAADIRLPDPLVADRHCNLIRDGDHWRVVALDAGRPTLVGGSAVRSGPLRAGDTLRIGSFSLQLDREQKMLTAYGSDSFSALSVRNLHRRIGKTSLLDDVSFTVFSGEVVAVVGPSGAGKTTLLSAIAGIAPAQKGQVILDGNDFHSMLAADRSLIGNVPQDDVVHAELTVEEALFYAGRIRFPSNARRQEIKAEVDRVLEELDIRHIRASRIGDANRRGISGGQRKRVNLGQELLTRSTRVLFLDEPTSGLDPQTAQDIVGLVRQLADDGRIVFLVTHDVSPAILNQVDHLMVLAPGGRLAWFGPPQEAAEWFGVSSPDGIFSRLVDKTPEQWGEDYRQGNAHRKYVRTREHLLGLDGVDIQNKRPARKQRGLFRQYLTMTSRYARVKVRDWSGTAVLLAQAPILGIAMWMAFPDADPNSLFMLALSTLWFGASASVRELIAERGIFRREARVGLRTQPYLASKVTVLGFLVGVQCVVLALMNFVMLGMWSLGFNPFSMVFICVLTGWVGMALGLCMSALFNSSEAAVGTLPLLLIPQITFGGLIVKVKEMGLLGTLISKFIIVRYSFESLIKTGDELNIPGTRGLGRQTVGVKRVLYDLGFRATSDDTDWGLPMVALIGALLAFLVVFMGVSWIFTSRSREGN